ncbi:hypothetical protein XarjCFBP7645_20945 [Xanthomonas arboricola]|uniref:Uncharacterized protein n=1 Tax=Xanthomonas arboricola TaxID=56448 RepID=A0A2S6YLY1_9XANT|nr:hypothetical protein XarjCFBP7652_21940 [Xanthomonas arboricola]PPU05156.1 hypothetical protein XarjCFBP7645_20945 [Xanthomonas arboricola]
MQRFPEVFLSWIFRGERSEISIRSIGLSNKREVHISSQTCKTISMLLPCIMLKLLLESTDARTVGKYNAVQRNECSNDP